MTLVLTGTSVVEIIVELEEVIVVRPVLYIVLVTNAGADDELEAAAAAEDVLEAAAAAEDVLDAAALEAAVLEGLLTLILIGISVVETIVDLAGQVVTSGAHDVTVETSVL